MPNQITRLGRETRVLKRFFIIDRHTIGASRINERQFGSTLSRTLLISFLKMIDGFFIILRNPWRPEKVNGSQFIM